MNLLQECAEMRILIDSFTDVGTTEDEIDLVNDRFRRMVKYIQENYEVEITTQYPIPVLTPEDKARFYTDKKVKIAKVVSGWKRSVSKIVGDVTWVLAAELFPINSNNPDGLLFWLLSYYRRYSKREFTIYYESQPMGKISSKSQLILYLKELQTRNLIHFEEKVSFPLYRPSLYSGFPFEITILDIALDYQLPIEQIGITFRCIDFKKFKLYRNDEIRSLLTSAIPIIKTINQIIRGEISDLPEWLDDENRKFNIGLNRSLGQELRSQFLNTILLNRYTGDENKKVTSLNQFIKLLFIHSGVEAIPQFIVQYKGAYKKLISSQAQFEEYIHEASNQKYLTFRDRSYGADSIFSIKILDKGSNLLKSLAENERILSSQNHHSIDEKFVILFLSAVPKSFKPLRVGEEIRDIRIEIDGSRDRNKLSLVGPITAVRRIDLSKALLDNRPNLVHFSGHGTEKGEICIEDLSGQPVFLKPEVLASLFGRFRKKNLECVLLNACYSKVLAVSISQVIPFVIGMDDKISDEAALAFSVGFYQALGAGENIEEAFNMGQLQIGLAGLDEGHTPQLFRKPKN